MDRQQQRRVMAAALAWKSWNYNEYKSIREETKQKTKRKERFFILEKYDFGIILYLFDGKCKVLL